MWIILQNIISNTHYFLKVKDAIPNFLPKLQKNKWIQTFQTIKVVKFRRQGKKIWNFKFVNRKINKHILKIVFILAFIVTGKVQFLIK